MSQKLPHTSDTTRSEISTSPLSSYNALLVCRFLQSLQPKGGKNPIANIKRPTEWSSLRANLRGLLANFPTASWDASGPAKRPDDKDGRQRQSRSCTTLVSRTIISFIAIGVNCGVCKPKQMSSLLCRISTNLSHSTVHYIIRRAYTLPFQNELSSLIISLRIITPVDVSEKKVPWYCENRKTVLGNCQLKIKLKIAPTKPIISVNECHNSSITSCADGEGPQDLQRLEGLKLQSRKELDIFIKSQYTI